MIKSKIYFNKINKQFIDIMNNFSNMYFNLKAELEDEILGEKKKFEETNEETKRIYDKLNTELCTKIIRKKLPWKVKLFNKINCFSYGIYRNGWGIS